MSRRKVQCLLAAVFGLDVSLGTLSESEQLVSDAVAPAVEQARMHALTETVKHLDATTWRERGGFRALWTLATTTVTVFTVLSNGTRDLLRTWIDHVRGVLVTDRGAQFDFWALERRQICWAHLVRKFAGFSERRDRAGEIGADLLLLARVLLHSWYRVRDGTQSRHELQVIATKIRALAPVCPSRASKVPVATSSITATRCGASSAIRTSSPPTITPSASSAGSSAGVGRAVARRVLVATSSPPTSSPSYTCRKQHRDLLPYLTSAIQAALHDRRAPSLIAAR